MLAPSMQKWPAHRNLWPTPTSLAKGTDDYNGAGNSAGLVAIRKHAIAATYPTPSASGFEARDPKRLLERRAECKERTNNGNDYNKSCLRIRG